MKVVNIGLNETDEVVFELADGSHIKAETILHQLDRLIKKDQKSSFQKRVNDWMLKCFGIVISTDLLERNHRFLEKALELVQAGGCTVSEAHQLVDYVFNRPVSEKVEKVGGVMVTLSAWCTANGVDVEQAAELELERINDHATVEKIRAVLAAKLKHSPLPQ